MDRAPGNGAAFAPTLALTVVLAFAGFGLLMSLVMLVVEPEPIVGLGTTQRQDAETGLYVAGFALILPLALVAGPRLADVLARGPNRSALSSLAALLWAALALAVLLVRVADGLSSSGRMSLMLGALGAWALGAAALVGCATRPRPWTPLLRLAGLAAPLWGLAVALSLATLFGVADLDSLSVIPLALAIVGVPLAALLAERGGVQRLQGRWGYAADLAAVALVLLAIPDLVIVRPEDSLEPVDRYVTGVIQFHHDFLLGPANQVLGGGTMLVDTASQYGVGSILFLTAWFQLVPIGYGTFGLLDGILTALSFAAGYGVLRMTGVSRLLAASALALAVVALVLNRTYPVGALPQEGPLRLGLPMLLILAVVAGARWPRFSRPARFAAFAVVGLSSVWALEGLAITAATFVALACFAAYLKPAGERLRWLAREGALALSACVAAHALFALFTLAASGELPDWGQYLAFLREFLFGNLGNLTYDFARWSPAVAVGAVYLASAAALVLLIRRRPDWVRGESVAVLALTGTTAYGIVVFNYFVDRSADHVLPYVCLPAVLTVALWLACLFRARPSLPRWSAGGAVALSLAVAALLVSVAWSSVGPRFEHSALSYALPGVKSARGALERLGDFPAIYPPVVEAERVLDRHMPGERRSLVLIKPALANETLMRSERSNRLPLSDPIEDGFADEERLPGLREAVADIEPGSRLLLDGGMLAALAAVKQDPDSPLLTAIQPGAASAPLQVRTLRWIDQRFRLRPVHTSPQGFVVVELEPRR